MIACPRLNKTFIVHNPQGRLRERSSFVEFLMFLLIAGAAWSLILRRKRSNRSNFTRDLGRKK